MTEPNSSTKLPVPADPSGQLQPLDRNALERVLARAAELQAGLAEPTEGMSAGQLEDLGREVGIGPEHIRQALAEERTRVVLPTDASVVGRWFGPGLAVASRIVKGTPAALLSRIDALMQGEELMRVRRRFSDRLTWEARRDLFGAIQAKLNMGGRAYALTDANEVGATVVAVDGDRSLVRVDADFTASRRRSVSWSTVVTGAGIAGAAGLVGIVAMNPGASLPIAGAVSGVWAMLGAGTGTLIAGAQRRRVARAQLALEQVLDRLELGEARSKSSSLLDLLSPVRR